MKRDLNTMRSIHRTKLDGPLQGAQRLKLPFVPTPKTPMIVSPSEIGSFLRCRLQWNWSYRVGISSRKMAPPRAIGIYVHVGKDQWYTHPAKKRTTKLMAKIADHVIRTTKLDGKVEQKDKDLARAMLIGFAQWATTEHEHSDAAIGKGTVRPEKAFALPLDEDGSIIVRGRIDEVFEPTIYRHAIAMDESKTRDSIGFDMLDLSYQMTTYLWAMMNDPALSHYKRFIAWRTVLRRQMPGPRVKAPLFGRESVERTDDEIRMWVRDLKRTVTDMLDAAIYPTQKDSCRWDCDFYQLCLVRANARDLKEIIRSEYTVKD